MKVLNGAYHIAFTPFSSSRVCAVAHEERTSGGNPKMGSMHMRRYCFVEGSNKEKKE